MSKPPELYDARTFQQRELKRRCPVRHLTAAAQQSMFRNTSDKEIEYRHRLRQPTAPLGSVICRESCHRTRFGVPRASHDRSRRFPLVAPTPLFSCKRSKFSHERTRPQARILSRPSEEEGNVRRSRKQGWATIGDKHRAGEIFRPQRHRLAEVLPSPSHIRNLQWSVRQNTACESIHHRSREISSREISLAKLHLSRCRVNASQSPGKTRDCAILKRQRHRFWYQRVPRERAPDLVLEAVQSNRCRIRIASGPSNVVFLTIPPLASGEIF